MATRKHRISNPKKVSRRAYVKALSNAGITNDETDKRNIQGAKILGGLITTTAIQLFTNKIQDKTTHVKETQLSVGGVTFLIGTADYVKKISNLPSFQNDRKVKKQKKQIGRKFLPKIQFSGEQ